MDSTDLESLLEHFEARLNHVNGMVPWARFCNHVVSQHDAMDSNGNINNRNDDNLPDMIFLSEMVVEMDESLDQMEKIILQKQKSLSNQKERIVALLEDLSSHLEYLSSNFPIRFGKSPEKPQRKYGIDTGVNRRQTQAPTAASRQAFVKAPPRKTIGPSSTIKGTVVNKTTASTTRPNDKGPINRVTNGNGPPAQNKSQPSTFKSKASGVRSTNKPTIAVRMTKKMITQMNYNSNRNWFDRRVCD